MPTWVSFREDAANGRTVVELISWDRPGLLCRVGQAFMEYGVQVHNAKIVTTAPGSRTYSLSPIAKTGR